jgi:UDP-N-acetylglucosamine--N-acetylmuramyl-(pentapeptide) pyrophosphoryl-undecaprenol N-acetylglucosamine transferase
MKRKVVIAAGGTGGHLFPAQHLRAELDDCEVIFAGHGLKESPFFDRKHAFREIEAAGLGRKFFKATWNGFFQSLKFLREFKPDVVVGFGSFHTFPLLLAAVVLRKKIVLFEANCTLGKVNAFFKPFASKIAVQFPVKMDNAVVVRGKKIITENHRDRKELHREKKKILVFGGSQGAAFINGAFCQAAVLLKAKGLSFDVIHLTGRDEEVVARFYAEHGIDATVKNFENDMDSAYTVSDIAVCRCGAGTVAELIGHKLPAVLIPYPYAHDHQRKNGEFLGARMILQREASAERLADEIEALLAELPKAKRALEELTWDVESSLSDLVRSV